MMHSTANPRRAALQVLALLVAAGLVSPASAMNVTGHGLGHRPLGEAHVELLPSGSLAVTNITDSGEDGVGVEVGESDGLHTVIRTPDDDFPLGARLTSIAWGRVDGELSQLTELRMARGEDGIALELDAVGVGSESFDVHLYLGGMRIHSEYDIYGYAGRILAAQNATVPLPRIGHELFDDASGAVTTLRSAAPFRFRCPNGGEMVADGLQMATNGYDRLSFVEFRFAGIDRCLVHSQDLVVFGQPHRAVGQATLESVAGELTVSNIGDSGRDGVDIDLDGVVSRRRTASFSVGIDALDITGGGLIVGLRGTAVGNPGDALVARASLFEESGELLVGAEFPTLGTPIVLVQLLHDGAPVAAEIVDTTPEKSGDGGGASGGMTTVNPPPLLRFTSTSEAPRITGFGTPQAGRAALTFEWAAPVEVTLLHGGVGANTVIADELRVTAVGAAPLLELSSLSVRGDRLPTIVLRSERRVETPPSAVRIPGDCNGDDTIDVSDPSCLLGHLFRSRPLELPCGDGTVGAPGNIALLDFNGDRTIDLSDAVGQLGYLFLGTAAHVLGTDPVAIAGCAE